MNLNTFILRSLKKNAKHYSLYLFALVFSVALYFSFVTLQFDPAMDDPQDTIKGAAAIRAGSVLLVVIVTVFLLYANHLFIKKRSNEIALFQLIGMTKSKVSFILTIENLILYWGAVLFGVFMGFATSKLIKMVFYKITGIHTIATLHFSKQAFFQTLLIFIGIYLAIMVMNLLFIKRKNILSLFRAVSTAEGKVQKMKVWEIFMGIVGFILIGTGYYISSRLFGGDFVTMDELFLAMLVILGSVILGTYLFYKGSVRLIGNLIRTKKDGYLAIHDVLSLSSIMFRMKSNAVLLTIITTVSALAIGLLSLSYISYYSTEKSAKQNSPHDFSIPDPVAADQFKKVLMAQHLEYKETQIEVLQVEVNLVPILDAKLEKLNMNPEAIAIPIIKDTDYKRRNLSADEILFTGYNDLLQNFLTLKKSGTLTLHSPEQQTTLHYIGLDRHYPISKYFKSGGAIPIAVVDESTFKKLKKNADPKVQLPYSTYIGIEMSDSRDQEKANNLFLEMGLDESRSTISQWQMIHIQKKSMGFMMFIVGFLGLTFLITSGCILYFKQMGESEDEKSNYTILRKLGFTEEDLVGGLRIKQLYHFGIPLLIGLLHSYFAVRSGWFLFGTELWVPMMIVMAIYSLLYSIFAVLSIAYNKKVIKESL